jgi:hypothetical protein
MLVREGLVMSGSHGKGRRGEERKRATNLVLGLGLMLLGSLMLLDRFEVLDAGDYSHYWPLLLVAMGLVQLMVPDEEGRRGGGLWLLATGVLLQLLVLRILRFRESWPLLLVVGGAGIALGALARGRRHGPTGEAHDA